MRRALILLGALAGCTQYARRSTHNAPPRVNLEEPPAHENGEPSAFTPGEDPGSETLAVFATPSLLLGSGRYGFDQLHVEPGFALRFEHSVDKNRGYLEERAFAITVGTGLATVVDNRPTTPSAVFAQLDYRFFAVVIPIDIGLGPVFYPGADKFDNDLGVQLDFKLTILEIRARYMADTGFELSAGYSIPIPFFFQRSR